VSSNYDWKYLHQGGRWDADAAVYSFRHREFSPTLGRWLQVDLVDPGLYKQQQYGLGFNNPITHVDPDGLFPRPHLPRYLPRPLTPKENQDQSRLFPNWDPKKVCKIGPPSDKLNCIAHAMGLLEGVIDSTYPPKGSKIKPPARPFMTLEYVEEVLVHYGFMKSENCTCVEGKTKVAIYAVERPGGRIIVRHAARCDGNSDWTSKLGPGPLIAHCDLSMLEDIPGKTEYYGRVIGCWEKPK